MSILSLFDNNIDNRLISVVGAGGKTSFLEAFLNEFKNAYRERKVLLLTSTTKMYNRYENAIIENNISNIEYHVKSNALQNNFLIFKDIDKVNNKLIGFSAKELDEIFLNKTFNTIISESDGAKNMEVKAHLEHEPNNPSLSTDIVAIVSLSAIGKSVIENVHRLREFIKITGCSDTITKGSLVALFNNNNNYFKNTDTKTKRHLIFNKADLIENNKLKYLFDYFTYNIKNVDTISFMYIKENRANILYTKNF